MHEIASAIPEAERPQRLREIGLTFGKFLASQKRKAGASNTLEGAIDNLILPAITPLAELTYTSNAINVSHSKVNLKPDQPKAECCAFLQGGIEGLLGEAEGLARHEVIKTHCVTRGDSECQYQLKPSA